MSTQNEIEYRIGDFARRMGVTSNFLKHYESLGLLKAKQSGTGYRYFGFHQSARILDYIRMRNCGVPLKDMQKMQSMDGSEAIAIYEESVEALKRRVKFETAVLEEHERFKVWYAERRVRPIDWEVRQIGAVCFLPHTKQQDFIRDGRIDALLPTWTAHMPIVKSAMLIEPIPGSEPLPQEWGLIVRASDLEKHGLPSNDIVREVPACKAFIYHFAGEGQPGSMEELADRSHPMFVQMHRLGLEPAGAVFVVVDMKFSDEECRFRSTYGRFIVPLR